MKNIKINIINPYRNKMLLLLKCPKCGNEMKYQSKGIVLAGKRKRCVYCGKGFKVTSSIIKKV